MIAISKKLYRALETEDVPGPTSPINTKKAANALADLDIDDFLDWGSTYHDFSRDELQSLRVVSYIKWMIEKEGTRVVRERLYDLMVSLSVYEAGAWQREIPGHYLHPVAALAMYEGQFLILRLGGMPIGEIYEEDGFYHAQEYGSAKEAIGPSTTQAARELVRQCG